MEDKLAEVILKDNEPNISLADIARAIRDANQEHKRHKIWPVWTRIDELIAAWKEARDDKF